MNSLKQELVNGKGYAILPIDDLSYFQKLKTQFMKKLNRMLKKLILIQLEKL